MVTPCCLTENLPRSSAALSLMVRAFDAFEPAIFELLISPGPQLPVVSLVDDKHIVLAWRSVSSAVLQLGATDLGVDRAAVDVAPARGGLWIIGHWLQPPFPIPGMCRWAAFASRVPWDCLAEWHNSHGRLRHHLLTSSDRLRMSARPRRFQDCVRSFQRLYFLAPGVSVIQQHLWHSGQLAVLCGAHGSADIGQIGECRIVFMQQRRHVGLPIVWHLVHENTRESQERCSRKAEPIPQLCIAGMDRRFGSLVLVSHWLH